ncbi:HSP20-like chaperone [Lentithecium fluviatile CBS 122367]|uniref:HSP20-like chaperone n=1 Tax=Lentithecium fluviatile CBS 122367 TaxID=1168545 RepID=A0A6G1IZN8_9PLEO|nr:HSP20-like chaperone [Lentithecium fluviatile CBS 122367]
MPSVQYMNRSAPFWDFVASLEQEGTNHPFFSQWAPNQNQGERSGEGEEGQREHRGEHPPPPPPFGPWGWGFPGFGGGRGFPHRGPPPPPGPPGPPSPPHGEDDGEEDNEKGGDNNDNDNGEGPSGSGSETEGCRRGKGRHGRCGSQRGHRGCGPHGRGFGLGPRHGGPPHHGHHGRRGGWGPCGRGGPFGFGGDPFNPLNFAANLFDPSTADQANKDNEDFTPDADIFSTSSAWVIHVSLPGAKKEDVGVNWDAEKSELSIAGVIYRPGDEEFLKTLDMGERKVGPFERKIRLGTRANPAVVDVEGITAKLEDGVLRVEVPKLEEGFVEVRKVDVE